MKRQAFSPNAAVRDFRLMHRLLRYSFLSCLGGLLLISEIRFSSFSASAQDAPLDASEISRDLLYVAPSHAELRVPGDASSTVFVGANFEYSQRSGAWSIRPSAAKKESSREKRRVFPVDFPHSDPAAEYELVAASDDDRATLGLRKKGATEAVVTLTLWSRDQLVDAWLPEMRKQKRGTTADSLRQDLEVADPEVRATARPASPEKSASEAPILVAVGQSSGEQEAGLATIVRFDPMTQTGVVFHPAGMLTCEVSTLGVSGRGSKPGATVWFGTRMVREGTIAPCSGLSQLDVDTRAVTPAPGRKNPQVGSIVTALAPGGPGGLVAATDEGICNLGKNGDDWECWRFVPSVTLADATPVANRPGDKAYGQLKPGDYAVLWANQNFLEVVTPDSYDAWLASDDFDEASGRNFDAEPYKLLNTSSGAAAPIRPLAKPKGEPLEGALEYRAPLEKLPAPDGTPAGWLRVRARVGWIARKNLEVAPKLIAVQK